MRGPIITSTPHPPLIGKSGIAWPSIRWKPLLPLALWLMLWAGQNTGVEVIFLAQTTIGKLHGYRSLLPLLAALLALWNIFTRGSISPVPFRGALGFMALYALLGIPGSVFVSPRPEIALGWWAAYVSVFLILGAVVHGPDSIARICAIISLNRLLVGAILLVLVTIGGDVISSSRLRPDIDRMPGYSVLAIRPEVGGMPMVRASGVGRYAAVLAIAALARLRSSAGWRLPYWALLLTFSLGVIVLYHSRSAAVGAAICTLGVLALRAKGQAKVFFLSAALLLAVWLSVSGLPVPAARYLARGADPATQYGGWTGRMNLWEAAFPVLKDSPLIGFGFHGDRLMTNWWAVHNAWLHALLQSGLLGTLCFAGGFITAWLLLFRALRLLPVLPAEQKIVLTESAGVLGFFTLRTVSESSGAYFGVDWLLLAPVFAYLQILTQQYRLGEARAHFPCGMAVCRASSSNASTARGPGRRFLMTAAPVRRAQHNPESVKTRGAERISAVPEQPESR